MDFHSLIHVISFGFVFLLLFLLFLLCLPYLLFQLQRYSYQRSCHMQEPNYQKLNRKCMDRNWTLAFCDFLLSLCNEVNNKFWQNSMNVQMEIKGWMGERENQKTKQEKKAAKKKVISFLDNSSCINILRCGQIYRRLLCTSFVNGVPFFSTVFLLTKQNVQVSWI